MQHNKHLNEREVAMTKFVLEKEAVTALQTLYPKECGRPQVSLTTQDETHYLSVTTESGISMACYDQSLPKAVKMLQTAIIKENVFTPEEFKSVEKQFRMLLHKIPDKISGV